MSAVQEIDAPPRHLRVMEPPAGYDAEERRPTPGEAAGGERHVRIPVNIFDCTYLSHGAVRLYGRLQQHMGADGCFPSYETLSARMGCSERAVREYRQELEDAGVIVHRRGGGARSNRYQLTPERLRDMSAKSAHIGKAAKSADIGAKSAKSAVESRQNLPPMSAKSAEESYLVNQTSLIKSTPTELTTAAASRAVAQGNLIEPEPHVAAVLDALSLTGAVSVKAVTAVVAAFPTVNHALAAACCAEWCANKRRKTSAATYRNWCAKEANGASDEENPGGAGPGRTGGAARARPGNPPRPANPQHAAHAAKLDW